MTGIVNVCCRILKATIENGPKSRGQQMVMTTYEFSLGNVCYLIEREIIRID
jgi:hypothetical protein